MSLTAQDLSALIKKNVLLSSCLALSVALGMTIYFRSDLGDAQQAVLDQKSTEGKRYHANLVNASQLTADLQTVIEANRVVRSRAINPADLARNLQYFYRLESEAGVHYTDLRPAGVIGAAAGAKGPAPTYVRVKYAVNLHGDFPQVINYLRNLENGPHFYQLESFTASGQNTAATTLNLTIFLLGHP